jgi:hypothetical protein
MRDVTSIHFDLFVVSETRGIYGLVVYNSSRANKVNRLLSKPYGDVVIQPGEEPMFRFPTSMLSKVMSIVAPNSTLEMGEPNHSCAS